jgi:enoyl-CoA hydratase/carnithine racemase
VSVVIDGPPMKLIGPELVRDLVTLVGELESDEDIRVMVLESADPEYFVPHGDLAKVAEYTAEAAKAGGPDDASLGMLWHKLSELPVVTIAKLRGRSRGAASELALACDMRFAARGPAGADHAGAALPGGEVRRADLLRAQRQSPGRAAAAREDLHATALRRQVHATASAWRRSWDPCR